jgi:Leucine-rich repeat (LRR) protein
MRDHLERLRAKLTALAVRDPDCDVFGSNKHRHRLAPPLDEAALAALETRLGARLPDEYRAFVTTIAASGAGPSYGLMTADEAIRELDDAADAGRPFPLTRADADRAHELRQHEATKWHFHPAEYPLPGCWPLCEHGCGWSSVLVLTGELRGLIWYAGDGWLLERDAAGQPLGFLAWYERWLDANLASPDIPNPKKTVFGLERALALKVPNTVGKLWMHRGDYPVVPETLGQLTRLEGLSLYSSKVERLPDSLGALTALRGLELGSNPIAELPASLAGLTKLEAFEATECPNLSAAHVIERLDGRALETLRLTGGAPCARLPDRLASFRALTALALGRLGLESLPALSELRRLERLDLPDNRLTALPEGIGALPLSHLDLARNRLGDVSGLAGLTSLTWLVLRENPLPRLPDLGGLAALASLDLGGLPLAELPAWLVRLPLTYLALDRLPELELGQACRLLAGTRVRTLRLGGPRLSALPDALADVHTLENLFIEDSPELDFEAALAVLARLPALRALRLPRNRLTAFPAGLRALAPRLEELDLQGNPLGEVPRWIGELTRLRSFDLGGTNVRLLPRELRSVSLSCYRFPPGAERET